MKISKGAVLFHLAAVMTYPTAAQPTGDDWKLVAYNFARANNYDIPDKDVTSSLDTSAMLLPQGFLPPT